MDRAYRRLVASSLKHRWAVLAAAGAAVLTSGFFFAQIDKGFMPEEDEGRFIVALKAPLGSSIEYTELKIREVEAVLGEYPEILGSFATIGDDQARSVSKANIIVNMARWEDRDRSQGDLMRILNRRFAEIPGIEIFVTEMPIVGGTRGDPLQFVLRGPELERVAKLAADLRAELMKDPEMGKLDLTLELDLPQLEVVPSRERLRSLGLTTRDVALAVNVLSGGFDVARYNDDPGDGERYDVRLKAGQGSLQQVPDLSRIYLRTPSGELVRLDNLVSIEQGYGPAVVSRYDLQYAANFLGTPIMAEAAAIDRVLEVSEGMLPPGYDVMMTGRSQEFGKTINYMAFAFVTAMILVYMVLASQFNSFIQPMIIMVAQPLAIIGGVGALWLTGHSLNIYSMIGLVLLVGLVAKNSILLVDMTNQLREEGMGIDEALERACPIRMRPVLMTSATIILALLPAALGLGAGSDTNGPLSVAVIGGLVSSTLLTLVVVPSLYSLVEHKVEKFRRRAR
jgi:HAE1 family hydrophobic/amphiphilic exporter-1